MATTGRYKAVKRLDQHKIDALMPLLTMREFCGIGGISMNTGRCIVNSGAIRSAKKVGHNWRIPKAEALSYFGLASKQEDK